jgi:hypothetical protein
MKFRLSYAFKEEEIMSELENKKLSDETLAEVAGGNDGMGDGTFSVYDINPVWVMVTADSLNCRYTPNGEIAKTYEYGHKLKVNGITTDGLWYRLWIYNPKGGECNGYIYKQYTQLI